MKTWSIKSPQDHLVKQFVAELKITPLTALLLANRGICNTDEATQFLFHSLKDLPDPLTLKDMECAVDRLIKAIQQNEKITIYGDYDVDGTAGTSLLFIFFREIDYPVNYYIPHRLKEGYSLNEKALRCLKKEGTDVLITVDNGITAIAESKIAQELGIDLIITDHHQALDQLPCALAIIDAHRKDCSFTASEICGTGVAFYLMMALRQRLRQNGFFQTKPEPDLKKYLDLVALATVADVVPLHGVNRIFVKSGLRVMENSIWPGIRALKQVSHVSELLNSYDLGFKLGPRLNACGRLYDASLGVQLLTSQDENEAFMIAQKLDQANQERRNIEKSIFDEAAGMIAQDQDFSKKMSYILYQPHWHVGVIGIVASRLAQKFFRPVILLGEDGEYLKGSARSFGGLNLVNALQGCESLLHKYGGHKAAAGLSLKIKDLDGFRVLFESEVKKQLNFIDLEPVLYIDALLTIDQINFNFIDELKLLEPFGEKNPKPLFYLKDHTARYGRIVGNNHLKFKILKDNQSMEAIAFGMGDNKKILEGLLDMAFSIDVNHYMGVSSIVLNVKDMRVSEMRNV